MTKTDKEYVDMAAELSAQKAVTKVAEALNVHSSEIATIIQIIKSNKGNIDGNKKGIDSNRKIYFIGIGALFLGLISEKLIKLFI